MATYIKLKILNTNFFVPLPTNIFQVVHISTWRCVEEESLWTFFALKTSSKVGRLHDIYLTPLNSPLWSISTQTLWHTGWSKNWQTNPKQNSVLWGQLFPWKWLESTWSCLVLVRNDQKPISRHNVCRLLVNERMHSGSSSILKVTFLGHPVWMIEKVNKRG